MDNRTSKQNYYLDIADAVLERSTCLRRKYGAIIVRNDEIISTGYNGAPRGRRNCSDLGTCTRETLRIPSGERYELCRSVHAEANAIISASRQNMIGASLYLVGRDAATNELLSDAMSCSMCKRQIINAGIDHLQCGDHSKDAFRHRCPAGRKGQAGERNGGACGNDTEHRGGGCPCRAVPERVPETLRWAYVTVR